MPIATSGPCHLAWLVAAVDTISATLKRKSSADFFIGLEVSLDTALCSNLAGSSATVRPEGIHVSGLRFDDTPC
jgi:hypothetical protein